MNPAKTKLPGTLGRMWRGMIHQYHRKVRFSWSQSAALYRRPRNNDAHTSWYAIMSEEHVSVIEQCTAEDTLIITRSSAITEGLHDTLCQQTFCQWRSLHAIWPLAYYFTKRYASHWTDVPLFVPVCVCTCVCVSWWVTCMYLALFYVVRWHNSRILLMQKR